MRRARKAARAASGTAPDERSDARSDRTIFSESYAGRRARDTWARRYDGLNGGPEGDDDR